MAGDDDPRGIARGLVFFVAFMSGSIAKWVVEDDFGEESLAPLGVAIGTTLVVGYILLAAARWFERKRSQGSTDE